MQTTHMVAVVYACAYKNPSVGSNDEGATVCVCVMLIRAHPSAKLTGDARMRDQRYVVSDGGAAAVTAMLAHTSLTS